MEFALESLSRLAAQLSAWHWAVLGFILVCAWWRRALVPCLTWLALILYGWVLYQYAQTGFDAFDKQVAFGLLVGIGLLLLLEATYQFFMRREA